VRFLLICGNRRARHAKKTPTCFAETLLERMEAASGLLPHHEDPEVALVLPGSDDLLASEAEVPLRVRRRVMRARQRSGPAHFQNASGHGLANVPHSGLRRTTMKSLMTASFLRSPNDFRSPT
jgi:hypothetical protein